MAEEAGFRIDGVLYPVPATYTIGDSVIVKMLGGLDMEDYFEGLAEIQEQAKALAKKQLGIEQVRMDPRLLASMIGVAVSRAHPSWSVERVSRFVQQIDMNDLVNEQGEATFEEVEEEVDPPSPPLTEPDAPDKPSDSETPTGGHSLSLAGESSNGQASSSDEPTQSPFGSPVSPITSAASGPGN